MTTTTDRRPTKRTGPPRRPAGTTRPARGSQPGDPLLAGVTAAAWALGAGLVALALPVLLVWATDARSGSGASAALRTVAQVWLLGSGDQLAIPGGSVGLVPLGLLGLPLALLWRAGRHAARATGTREPVGVVRLTAAIAVPYALGSAILAALAVTASVRPSPVVALGTGLLVATVGAGAGILREARCARWLVEQLPARVRGLSVGTAAAVTALLGAGALLAGASLAGHGQRAGALAASSSPGIVGGLALLVVGLLLVPNAAVWGLSWLSGSGFAVGVGTSVSPVATVLGPVPAVPLLAALPTDQPPTWVAVLALVVPVLAGALAGAVVAPRLAVRWLVAAAEAALLGPCAGVAVAVLAALSGGPLGGGRLAAVGPSPWRTGLAVAVEVAVGAAVTTAGLAARRDHRAAAAATDSATGPRTGPGSSPATPAGRG